jgi:hypothetical protein
LNFTHELSALKKRRGIVKVEHLTAVPRGGNRADDETTRRAVEGHGEQDHLVGSGRNHRRDGSNHEAVAEAAGTHGYSGLLDRRKGRPSDRQVPLAKVEKVPPLYRDSYFDLNMRHFHEKLRGWHGWKLWSAKMSAMSFKADTRGDRMPMRKSDLITRTYRSWLRHLYLSSDYKSVTKRSLQKRARHSSHLMS